MPAILAILYVATGLAPAQSQIPHLQKHGTATQLIVDGRPFLILGGELHNSSSSDLEYMRPIWKRMVDLNFNTVLAAISWELVEPREGQFDFRLVDGLIEGGRRNNLRLVFLWFGSWKNGMSSYVPAWVKRDPQRFPRVRLQNGRVVEVLSTLSPATAQADAKAFGALMRHIREVDAKAHTVIMVQVENEVGVLRDSRDRSELADAAFSQAVPRRLLDYIAKNRRSLHPGFAAKLDSAGQKTSGTWTDVFGPGPETDEIFMAWNYANYVDKVAAAGKAEYPIPFFVNAWLSGKGQPGDWPSGGPLPHVLDVWRAATEHIDLFTPDIYQPNFAEWCARYTHGGSALFIPEMNRDAVGARNVFYAIGRHDAIGTSPFAVDSIPNPDDSPLSKSYGVLAQIAPLILEHQGKREMTGFLLDKENRSVKTELGDYDVEISLDSIFGMTATNGYGLIIQTGADEFIGAGSGFHVAFAPKSRVDSVSGIASVDEGSFSNGQWIPGRRLNGDENDQGQHWRFSPARLSIERCVLYR